MAGIIEPQGPRLHKRTIKAFTARARDQMNEDWFHSSFWGGAFPVGEKACGRQAEYKLMNPPNDEPRKPLLVATAHQGKSAEDLICEQWAHAGLSLVHREGGLPMHEQLRLKDTEHWLSTAIDDVLDLRPDWGAVTPVDVKSKAERVIEDMKRGDTPWQPEHRAQVICYCYVCRLKHEEMGWDKLGLRKAEGGFVYYVSRDNPSNGIEFYFEYDEAEVEDALALLVAWRESFVAGKLIPRDKSWKWLENPCKYCDFKRRCKADHQAGVETLAESNVAEQAKVLDPKWDFDTIQKKVIRRWT